MEKGTLMTEYVTPLASRADAVGVEMWMWADHDGFHCSPELTASEPVPTGHIWGWGPGVKVHLREDPCHPTVGVTLTKEARDGSTEAKVQHYAADDETRALPSIVTDTTRFLRCASDADERQLRALTLEMSAVVSPTNVILVGEAY